MVNQDECEKIDFGKLVKESFWDYNLDKTEIIEKARHGSFREKKHIFEKILFNSSDCVRILMILFNKSDLEELFNSVKINRYKKYAERNIQLAKYFLIDKNIRIKELEWKKS
ncbi:MAG: hypothetical protein RBT69_02235 [Spirochaetia bacterium]|jgi:hypothetical protein|nr:hypothetical protein [Spirochaetia bacterium]